MSKQGWRDLGAGFASGLIVIVFFFGLAFLAGADLFEQSLGSVAGYVLVPLLILAGLVRQRAITESAQRRTGWVCICVGAVTFLGVCVVGVGRSFTYGLMVWARGGARVEACRELREYLSSPGCKNTAEGERIEKVPPGLHRKYGGSPHFILTTCASEAGSNAVAQVHWKRRFDDFGLRTSLSRPRIPDQFEHRAVVNSNTVAYVIVE